MNLSRFALLSLLALPLSAAGNDPAFGFEATGSVVIASQDTNRLLSNNNLAGTILGVGFRAQIHPGLNHRLHLNLMGLKAAQDTGMSGAAPKHLVFGWDIMQDVGKWSFFGGVMGVKWKQDIQADTAPKYQGLRGEPKGTKFGARIGAEYAHTPNLHSTFSYNQTEFNRDINPGWWGVGLTYRFGGW